MAVSSPDTRSDDELVAAAQAGDRDAFVELYQRYFNGVFDFATRMTRDRDEAGDVAQETFIKAMERIDTLEDGRRFKSWVFTIARNETLDRLRRSKRVRPLAVRNEAGDDEPLDVVDTDRLADPADAAEANAVAALVWEAAAGLDPRQLSLLDLHLRQGLSSAEIAEVMGVSRNNGYVMVNRLKDAVQATIEAFLLFRQGRGDCAELASIVDAHETAAMSPELRRAIGKHAAGCADCTERKQRLVAPLAVLGALAPIPPAAALADQVLANVLEHAPPEADAPEADEGHGADADADAPPSVAGLVGGAPADEATTLVDLDTEATTRSPAPTIDSFDPGDIDPDVEIEPEV